VQHAIDTGSVRPIRLRPHRLALAKRQAVEEKVREMAAGGVIEPSSSPWAAPPVLVRNKDGNWRFCVDYRRLNEVTRKDSYPLPRIDGALDYIGGSSWLGPRGQTLDCIHHRAGAVAVTCHAVRTMQRACGV
jgi:hypothetical protein